MFARVGQNAWQLERGLAMAAVMTEIGSHGLVMRSSTVKLARPSRHSENHAAKKGASES